MLRQRRIFLCAAMTRSESGLSREIDVVVEDGTTNQIKARAWRNQLLR